MSAFTRIVGLLADDLIAAKDELCRLDGAAGDGDLGLTMADAAQAVKELLPELDGQDLAPALKRMGSEIARKAPSTTGTLLATACLRAGRAAETATGTGAARLATLLEAAQQGIQERGKAAVGDKTLLDALVPAVEAVRQAADAGDDVASALAAAAESARSGAEATKALRPMVGRASWMADRSVGHVDAGAHLVALLLASASRHTAS